MNKLLVDEIKRKTKASGLIMSALYQIKKFPSLFLQPGLLFAHQANGPSFISINRMKSALSIFSYFWALVNSASAL